MNTKRRGTKLSGAKARSAAPGAGALPGERVLLETAHAGRIRRRPGAGTLPKVSESGMKTLYLDIFSGISGDMFVAALIDLGVDPDRLDRELAKLKLEGYHLHVAEQEKNGIAGIKFDVHVEGDSGKQRVESRKHDHLHHEHGHAHHSHDHHQEAESGKLKAESEEHDHSHHDHEHTHHGHSHDHDDHEESRNFAQIKQLIGGSKLSSWVKAKAVAVFQRLAEVEGQIHGHLPEEVHFHEVGAVDSIVDIVSACIGLEMLGKPRVLAAPVVEGTGWIQCAHGRFPLPAPATLGLLGARGIALTQCAEPNELVTPTGAALLAEFAESFGPMDNLVAEKIGFGLGSRENRTRPNVLRAILGQASVKSRLDWETDRVAVLETNCDDITAEILGQFMETALAAGALDVLHTPVQMKKNRPGVLLTVLCAETDADKFSELILRETTSFGVRRTVAERRKLPREFVQVKTKFGSVTVKIGRLNGEPVQIAPEFGSCKKLALAAKVPLAQVYEAARQGYKK